MPLDGTALPTVGDDLASTDEVKVFKDEGDDENRENLTEDKLGLVSETEAGKCSVIEHTQFLIDGQTRLDCSFLSYSSRNRLSFGYPLVAPYPYPYGSIDLRGLALTAGGFPFYMYNSDLFPAAVPPPAHIRLPVPWHLGSHRSFASHQASVYGLVSPTPRVAQNSNIYGLHRAQTPPVYGIPSPYRQFPHSFCHSELPSSIGWGGSTMSLPCPYPSCQLPEIGPMMNTAPPASLPLPSLSARISSYSGMSLTAAVKAVCEPRRSLEVRGFSNHQRVFLSRHSRLTRQKNVPSVSGNHFHSAKVPHIKKPLNAFMIFMKEMRKKVIDECTLKESAAINQILGRRWHALDRKEQAKYYEMARKEKERHRQLYPMWSARDNYAIHSQKKRRRNQMHHEEKSTDADDDRECLNAKKCRARFGLDRQSQWCKPCRRKKRCIRFMRDGDANGLRWLENPFQGVGLPPDSTSERLGSVPEDSEIPTQTEETRRSNASSPASEGGARVSSQVLSKSLRASFS